MTRQLEWCRPEQAWRHPRVRECTVRGYGSGLAGGGSEAGGGGKGWGSEPLAETDGFVVESERSPGGTHRQRKRTARELAALRAG